MEQNVLRMLDSMIGTTEDPQMKRALERNRRETERLEEWLRQHDAISLKEQGVRIAET